MLKRNVMPLPNVYKTPPQALREFVADTGIPLLTLSNGCGLTSIETLKWWSGKNYIIRHKHVANLGDYLGIAEDSILNSTYNRQLVRRRIFDSKLALPEIYEEKAESYVRSSAYILEYLRLLFGQSYVDDMLQKMNVHPCFFDDEDRKINILFIMELLHQCKALGFSAKDFKSLTSSMFLSIENSKISNIFKPTQSYEDAYSMIHRSSKYFDGNFEYNFSISKTGVLIKSTPQDHTINLLEKSGHDAAFLHEYRGLIFLNMPVLCQLPALDFFTKKKCVSLGNAPSEYEIQFPQQQQLSLIRHPFL